MTEKIEDQPLSIKKQIFWICLFSIGFAFIESTIVVYLRKLYYPDGFAFPIKIISGNIAAIEIARELATLIVLTAVSILTGRKAARRLAFFFLTFGVWDIFYYVWLKALLDWPQSLMTWDILFLIPLPWLSPVIAPILVSISFIIFSVTYLCKDRTDNPVHFTKSFRNIEIAALILIFLSFIWDYEIVSNNQVPGTFCWFLFIPGLIIGWAGFLYKFLKTLIK